MQHTRRFLAQLAFLTLPCVLCACGDSSGPAPLALGQYTYTVNDATRHFTQTGTVSVTTIPVPYPNAHGLYVETSFKLGDSLRVNATVGQGLPDTVSRYAFSGVCQPTPSACFSLFPELVDTLPTVIMVSDTVRSVLTLTPVSSTEVDGSFDVVEIVDYVPSDSLAGIHGRFRAALPQ